jgi:uncharacterized cupin superfamily protein
MAINHIKAPALFAAGDAAFFPPFTHGIWIIHETLRKTYVVWRHGVPA